MNQARLIAASSKARIVQMTESASAPTRGADSTRVLLLVAASLTTAMVIFYLSGGVRVSGRSSSLLTGTTIGTGIIAAIAFTISVWRGRSMLGRSRAALLSAALLAPLALLAWKIWYSSQFAHGLDSWPGRPGLHCLGLTLALSTLPLLALLHTRRGSDPTHPRTAGFGLGAAIGLGAAVLVDMSCPVADVNHLLLGHLLPILVLSLAGFSLGRTFSRPKG